MQAGHKRELPRRSRYYQSVADVSTTPSGTQYRDLPDNIVIFICTFDPFDKGYPRYTFEFTCAEAGHRLRLGDGSLRVFLNTRARKLGTLDQKLRAFYHYLQRGVAESELTKAITGRIATLKNDSITRRHYMTWALKMADARYDGFDEGFEKGREDGISIGLERGAYQTKLETARTLLSMELSPQQVAQGTKLPLETVERLARE